MTDFSNEKSGLKKIIFALSFVFLLFTSAPTVQPYRDTGELACVGATLSVAHPPIRPAILFIQFWGSFLMRQFSSEILPTEQEF